MDDIINLVNEKGDRIGLIEKLEAHLTGQLHEAFSIFIFNTDGQLLLQKRNEGKYHSGGLWSNTCCSHPREGELLSVAVHRRLREEMGFDCEMKETTSFVYKVNLENGLVEHEFDHIFIGYVKDVVVKPDPNEVSDYTWISPKDLKNVITTKPKDYTEWLKIVVFKDLCNNLITHDKVAQQ